MLKEFLTLTLFGDSGLVSAGAPVVVGGKPVVIFARLTNMLTDGEGLAKSLQWKGASSLKTCFRHWNVLMRGSDLACRGHGFVEMSCPDPALFKRSTNRSVGEVVDLLLAGRASLRAGTITKTAFEEIEKASGFSVTSEGLLADANLRPHVLKASTFDWMHTALADGTLSVETWLLVVTCEQKIGVGMPQLEEYFRLDWKCPKALQQKSRYLYNVWSVNRKSKLKLKCSCSEMMGLYKLLLHFVETRIASNPAVAPEVESFRACCKTVDIILRAKRRTDPGSVAAALEAAISHHMRLHVTVYGDAHIKPKHHWMFDVAEQFRRDPFILDMFVVERLHLDIKRVAENVKNTRNFERSVLARKVAMQATVLDGESLEFHTKLLGDVQPFPGVEGAFFSGAVFTDGLVFNADDVVLRDGVVGVATAFVNEGGEFMAVVREFALVRRISDDSACWRFARVSQFWSLADVTLAAAWYTDSASGDMVVLVN
jgi:hypothetical protein